MTPTSNPLSEGERLAEAEAFVRRVAAILGDKHDDATITETARKVLCTMPPYRRPRERK